MERWAMKQTTACRLLCLLVLGACLGRGSAGVGGEITTLSEARALAREYGQPILIETSIKGCGSCRRFAKAVREDADIQRALEGIVLLEVDVEKGDGVRIRQDFAVRIFPTFLLLDADLRLIDRWFGFLDPEVWIETMAEARGDLDVLTRKRELYARTPTRERAAALARDAFLAGRQLEAVEYYGSARRLDPAMAHRYVFPLFFVMQDDMRPFSAEQLTAAADSVFANEHRRPLDLINVAQAMIRLAGYQDDPDLMLPYVERALAETGGTGDTLVEQLRWKLAQARAKALAASP
jgi:hypothetical protein